MGNPQRFAVTTLRVLVVVTTCPGCGVEATSEVFSPERLDTYPRTPDIATVAEELGATYISRGTCFDGWGRVGSAEACGKCVAKAEKALSRG